MSDTERTNEVLILQVIEQVEKRTENRETKRFRTLYVIFALVSFIGIGVISQIIELYTTRAVDQRLEQATLELESAKLFTQLLALATKLDLSPSFSHTDRDATVRLLEIAVSNKKLRAEPAFDSVLEKVIDSFAAADNHNSVSRIFDLYEVECLRISGVTETLMQHYAMRILASTDVTSESFIKDHKRFQLLTDASASTLKGTSAALSSLAAFKLAGSKPTPQVRDLMASYMSFPANTRGHFIKVVERFSDAHQIAGTPTPEIVRIASIGKAFQTAYAVELAKLGTTETQADE